MFIHLSCNVCVALNSVNKSLIGKQQRGIHPFGIILLISFPCVFIMCVRQEFSKATFWEGPVHVTHCIPIVCGLYYNGNWASQEELLSIIPAFVPQMPQRLIVWDLLNKLLWINPFLYKKLLVVVLITYIESKGGQC